MRRRSTRGRKRDEQGGQRGSGAAAADGWTWGDRHGNPRSWIERFDGAWDGGGGGGGHTPDDGADADGGEEEGQHRHRAKDAGRGRGVRETGCAMAQEAASEACWRVGGDSRDFDFSRVFVVCEAVGVGIDERPKGEGGDQ